ncbi:MAG: glycosyltransferase family 2 protein [Bacteroidales bacterium]|nr:glycosyltransferase family 2 protein [Bacteroidales bacterium]
MVTSAVLITCHNRKDTTLSCLGRLFAIRKDVDVYCVDDNSTDGTADAIRKMFPQVILIHGDGNLFWCRGMRKAWTEASGSKDYDFYFWLNDDLLLYDDCFDEMLECSELLGHQAVIAGLVQEKTTKQVIYGGYDKSKRLIPADGQLNEVYNLNGNFVLVPKSVFVKIGIFDPVYHHDLGDVAYGYEAHKQGLRVCTSRKYIGCTDAVLQSKDERKRQYGVSVVKRFKKLYSPLGSNPFITFHFLRRYEGIGKAVLFFIYVHTINLLPDGIWSKISKK